MSISARILVLVIMGVMVLVGCGGDGGNGDSPTTSNGNGQSDGSIEMVTITIGNITDLTGPGAEGIKFTNTALEDIAQYYNDNNIIPGVEFKIEHWDGQMDSAKTVPGYEWLKQKGADLISTCAPGVAVTLEPMVNADNMVLFTQAGQMESIDPPGYVFCLGAIPQYEAYTLLSWIADNHWDYKSNGPAKIGLAAWAESYAEGFLKATKDYVKSHPDQFEFVDGYLPGFKFDWASEVENLKECDYIFPPIVMQEFAKDLREAGSDATLIGGAAHTGFFEQIGQAGAWPAIDGMLFIFTGAWWTEDVAEVNFNKMLINEYHPGEMKEITSHSGYGSSTQYRAMFDLIENTVKNTGPEASSSEAIYETAKTWSMSWGYRADYSFGPEKRFLINDLCVQEADAAVEDIVRNDPNYYPILTRP